MKFRKLTNVPIFKSYLTEHVLDVYKGVYCRKEPSYIKSQEGKKKNIVYILIRMQKHTTLNSKLDILRPILRLCGTMVTNEKTNL